MHRVLIVDDEPNIVLALQLLLRKEGYEIRAVDDGEQAVAAAREFRPEVILLDVMLPRMDGYEVCRRLRADPQQRGVHIIMLTARGREAEREKGLALGADVYVTKPFSTRDVVHKVREALSGAGPP